MIKEYPIYSVGANRPLVKNALPPIKMKRDPRTDDVTEVGRYAINTLTGKYFILTDVTAGVATWSTASGAATFTNVTVTGIATMDAITSVNDIVIAGANDTGTAITLNATDAAGGILLSSGTSGLGLTSTGDVGIYSTGGDIEIGADATVQNLYLNTGAAVKTTVLGSNNTTSITTVRSGTAGTTIISTGDISVGADATAQTLHIGDGAAVKDTILGSTNTTSSTTLQAGSTGIAINAAGIVSVELATDTQTAAAVTINANAGYGIFNGLTTAAAGVQVLTVTNSVCTVDSAILCTLSIAGDEDAQCTIRRVQPKAGSFEVTYINNGAAAVATDLTLTFWILKA